MFPALPPPSGSSGDRLLADMTDPFDSATLCAVTLISPPLAFSAEVAIVLALLVNEPEDVTVTFPASPASGTAPPLLLVISARFASVTLSPIIVMSPARPVLREFLASALAADAGAVCQTHGAGPHVHHHVPSAAAGFAGRAGIDEPLVQGQRISRDSHLAGVLREGSTEDLSISRDHDRVGFDRDPPAGPIDWGLPAAITAPFVMVNVSALTVISPGKPNEAESETIPVF